MDFHQGSGEEEGVRIKIDWTGEFASLNLFMIAMKNIVLFGEALLRLSPPNHLRFAQTTAFEVHYGGAELNTAISLSQFGLPAEFVTRLPQNDLSKGVVQQLKRYGVLSDNISYGGKRLGIYYLEQGAVMRGSKVIYDREHSSLAEIEPGSIDWRKIFSGADWFHTTGITPAISEAAFNECLQALRTASEMGLTISFDLNYRSKLWQYGKQTADLVPQLMQYCHVVLGDRQTVKNYFGIQSSEPDEKAAFADVMRQLQTSYPSLQHIVFSYRHVHAANNNTIGALYLHKDKLVEAREQSMEGMVDRLGSGDALMAGLIYGIRSFPADAQKCVEFAVTAAALKSSIPGDTNLVTTEEVLEALEGRTSGKINR